MQAVRNITSILRKLSVCNTQNACFGSITSANRYLPSVPHLLPIDHTLKSTEHTHVFPQLTPQPLKKVSYTKINMWCTYPIAPSLTLISLLTPMAKLPIVEIEAKNDIKIRRRKMKKHKKRKWCKKHISLIRKLAMQQEKKEEAKLQELFTFWRSRSDAWDPRKKVSNRLNFARRSGYHIDILNTPDAQDTSVNAITASRRGQESLEELLSGLRDLMLPFYMDPKIRGPVNSRQALTTAQQCYSTMYQMQTNKSLLKQAFFTVKEKCDKLPANEDPSSLIPYKDSHQAATLNLPENQKMDLLLKTRDSAAKRLCDVTAELEVMQKTLTSALWDVNDLLDTSIFKS